MKIYTIDDVVTVHPGGLRDVVDFIHRNKLFDRERVERIVNRINVLEETWLESDQVPEQRPIESMSDIIDSKPYGVMSKFLAVCRELGLPLPGEKSWAKPSSEWRRKDDGSFS